MPDATDATFEEEILRRSVEVPVVVDLWAPWCGPCRTLGPILERVVEATDGAVVLAKVNVDENPAVSASFQVQSIPAVFALRDGKVVDQFIGALPEAAVAEFVSRLVPAPTEADRLAAEGEASGSEETLRQALELQPDHPGAIVALARALIGSGETDEAIGLLGRIPETADTRHLLAEARLAAGHVQVDGADVGDLLDGLLERVREDTDGAPGVPRPPRDARSRRPADRRLPQGPRRAPFLRPPSVRRPAAGVRAGRRGGDSVTVVPETTLALGGQRFDLTHRALVMGIINRTPDSFYDRGATFDLDLLLRRADELVAEGADILDVGGVKAGPGPEVGEEEELDRVVPAIAALRDRVGTPLSVDTWRAAVASEAFAAGAVLGNDISGFADPGYLPAATAAGASVVATHIRLGPRIPDPEPVYDDVVASVADFLADRAARATAAGLSPERVVLDAGLDLGKTAEQSLLLLRASDRLAALGHPLLLSASNKTFLGRILGLEIGERGEASLAAAALGISLGCRIVRVHEVGAHRQLCRVLAAISDSRVAAGRRP